MTASLKLKISFLPPLIALLISVSTRLEAQDWRLQSSGVTSNLRAVYFADSLHGIAAGEGGTILRTTDGGETWAQISTGTYAELNGLAFYTPDTGIAMGFRGEVLHTWDGGRTWVSSPISAYDVFNAVQYQSRSRLFAGSDRKVWESDDGGWNWRPMTVDNLGWNVQYVSFFGSVKGWIGTNTQSQIAYRVVNGVFDSTYIYTPIAANGCAALDTNMFVLVGPGGIILQSSDGGASWNTSQLGAQFTFNGVSFCDRRHGIAVGTTIATTSDGGLSWSSYPEPYVLRAVFFTDTLHATAVGDNGVILRFDTRLQTASIRQIQQVPMDSLQIADSVYSTPDARQSLQGSSVHDQFLSLTGQCVVPPLIFYDQGYYTAILYDTASGSPTWRGVALRCDHGVPGGTFITLNAGDLVKVSGVPHEQPAGMLSNTVFGIQLSYKVLATGLPLVAPVPVKISDFFERKNSVQVPKFRTGEQYEGMMVEFHNVTVNSVASADDGTFNFVDGDGFSMTTSDASAWFTNSSRRNYFSTYDIPPPATHIDTLRGIILTTTGSDDKIYDPAIRVAPVWPGDIVLRPSMGVVRGHVFHDLNNDGVWNPGEPGLSRWTMQLSGKALESYTTDSSGTFQFTGMDSGRYVLRIAVPAGWKTTVPTNLVDSLFVGWNDTVTIADIPAAQNWCSVSGMVFNDRNKNGSHDPGEPVYPSTRIWLGNGDAAIDSLLTDSAGRYAFPALYPGLYEVRVDCPEGSEVDVPQFQTYYSFDFGNYGIHLVGVDFGIHELPVHLKMGMTVHDNLFIGQEQLWWGIRPGATAGIWGVYPKASVLDYDEGEIELPPVTGGFFDARFIDPTGGSAFGNGAWTDMRGFVSPGQDESYVVTFSPGYIYGGNYPVTLRWSKQEVRSAFDSVSLIIPHQNPLSMMTQDSVVISDTTVGSITIHAIHPKLSAGYENQWNMISLPQNFYDGSVGIIFPTATSAAFLYTPDSGYTIQHTISPGRGYWLHYIRSADVLDFDPGVLLSDTVQVIEGWNIIGSLSSPTPFQNVSTVPGGILEGKLWGYNGGYFRTDTLQPLNSYWVKVRSAGSLILTKNPPANLPQRADEPDFLSSCNRLHIEDAVGNRQVLYFTSLSPKPADAEEFAMPPLPPEGIFSASFSGNTLLAAFGGEKFSRKYVELRSATYPVSVGWDITAPVQGVSLSVGTRHYSLQNSGRVIIRSAEDQVSISSAGRSSIVRQFSLGQNYPNPFNPVTTIRYAIPSQSRVVIRVYNILGEEIRTLVDWTVPAGEWSVSFNGGNLPSGIYWYRMSASGVVQVKKMILLK